MLSPDEILQKVINDDFEGEAIKYLTEQISEESRKPSNEIDYEKICDLMYEKVQLLNRGKDE